MDAFNLAPLILVFPVIGVLINAFIGRRIVEGDRTTGERLVGWLASLMAIASFVIAVLLALSLAAHEFHAETVALFDWFNIPSAGFRIPWAIQVDTLSVTMMLVVTGVGSLIHIYAIGYMHGDPDFSRFFTYLNLFLFFMLILITGNNYLMLFVGWEGVGLCSFLLIGFWFDRVDEAGKAMNANAARKAFVANRVGDFAMIMAMCLLFWTFQTLEFNPIFEQAAELAHAHEGVELFGREVAIGAVLTAVTVLFLIGATGKSAQIPLYVWLPDAMAGPTPVSALIHAATMVTSGIYLIVRSNVLFEIVRADGVPVLGLLSANDLVAYTGALTALFAGLIAFTQFDIKKVLAYSTVSQLGFMIAAAGMGAYVAAMFHLITHAFFKALLFLGSGSVIHAMEHGHHHLHDGQDDHHDDHAAEKFDPQDMRNMGGLWNRLPITKWVYLIGAIALAGLPIFAGFWSKDEILAHAGEHNQVVYILLTIAAFCTAFYMTRQYTMVFLGKARHAAAEHASDSPPVMWIPLAILAVLSIVGGFLNFPFNSILGVPADPHPEGAYLMLDGWLHHSLESFHLDEEGIIHLPHTPLVLNWTVAALSTGLAVVAILLAYFLFYQNRPRTNHEPDPLQTIPGVSLLWRWFSALPLNTLYMRFIVPAFNRIANWLAFVLDERIWHDFFHDNIIRDAFFGIARAANELFDARIVDGLVNGSASLARGLAGVFRTSQTGYARNYALGILLGVVALLAYFIFMAQA
jgi:NADH-quinone oxidoreductase subunit L